MARCYSAPAVGVAITSSLDIQVTLLVLLQHVVEQSGVDAANVLPLRPNTHSLEYVAGRGFRPAALERTQQRLWDALRSDRPYRSAWPEARVRDHIRALSGTHFDPRIVAAFLQVGQLPT